MKPFIKRGTQMNFVTVRGELHRLSKLRDEAQSKMSGGPCFDLNGFASTSSAISSLLEELRGFDPQFMYSPDLLDRMANRLSYAEQTICNVNLRVENFQDQIRSVENNIKAENTLTIPERCDLTCDLKNRSLALRREAHDRVDEIRKTSRH